MLASTVVSNIPMRVIEGAEGSRLTLPALEILMMPLTMKMNHLDLMAANIIRTQGMIANATISSRIGERAGDEMSSSLPAMGTISFAEELSFKEMSSVAASFSASPLATEGTTAASESRLASVSIGPASYSKLATKLSVGATTTVPIGSERALVDS